MISKVGKKNSLKPHRYKDRADLKLNEIFFSPWDHLPLSLLYLLNGFDYIWDSMTVNPLSPNIHLQILQTDLHTFPLRIS